MTEVRDPLAASRFPASRFPRPLPLNGRTGAQVMCEALSVRENVESQFGHPGGAIMPFITRWGVSRPASSRAVSSRAGRRPRR